MTEQPEGMDEPLVGEDTGQYVQAFSKVVDDGLFGLDSEGRFVDVNEPFLELTASSRDELLGTHASAVFDPAVVERVEQTLRAQLGRDEDASSTTVQGRLEPADGTSMFVELRVSPLVSDGAFRGLVGRVHDHGESGAPTAQPRPKLEETIATVLDEANVAVFLLDADLEVAWIDETAERYFGIERADVLGRDKYDLIETTLASRVADGEAFANTLFAAYDDNDTPERFECQITPGEGREERWLEHRSEPIESGAYAGGRIEFYYDVTDRKHSERARQERNQQFRSLVQAVEEYAIFSLDPDGHVVTWNQGAKQIKGYDREEIIGEHFSTFYTDPDVETGVPAQNLQLAAAEGSVEDEGWRLRKDGSRFWASVTITAIRDDDGELQGFAKVTRDMTDRREQARLRHRERLLERYKEYTDDVLDAIDDVFYVLDEDGGIRRWNESLTEVTGYTDEEIGTMHAPELFDADDVATIVDAIQRGFETGSVQLEAAFETKDGASIPYEFVASTLETPDGSPVLAGIGRDVTDRKQREAKLQERARQQEAVAELGQFALETDDLDDLMEEAARLVADVLDNEYCKVLDLDETAGELLLRQGVGWQEGIVGSATVSADESDSQAAYTLANDHPIVVDDLETETRFSGPKLLTSHEVRSGISTIIGPFDEPWGILGTHDTERRAFTDEDVNFVQSVANILAEAIERHQYHEQLEELVADLEESNERLEQFAYAASHDLQEPLRMVSSYLRMIESRYADDLDDDGEEFLEFAVDGADRMREMIEALLEYSRIESRGNPIEPVELDAVLESVLEDLQVRIEESGAEITAEDLPRVQGDESQLRQVFLNLLDNAIEYSGDDPPVVEVSAERAGKEWIISVRDEGIGIDPDDTDRIFQVFQRLHSRDAHEGTGIGLALCKRIVERHDGDIWVDSEPGVGTTFSFSLPAADAQNW